MKWICPKCGEVEPKEIYDSYPSSANCPKCGKEINDGRKINILYGEEARKIRPEFYERLEKIKKLEKNLNRCPNCGTNCAGLITGKDKNGKSQFDRVVCTACGTTGPWYDGHPEDAVDGWNHMSDARKLVELCEDFIRKNQISCGKAIHQCEWVSNNSLDFIQDICKIVGYYDSKDKVVR